MGKIFGVGAYALSKSHYSTEYTNASDSIKKLVGLYEQVVKTLSESISDDDYMSNKSIKTFIYSFNWVLCQRNYQKTVMWKDILFALEDIANEYPSIKDNIISIKEQMVDIS